MAIVTGASRGIGSAIAAGLADQGSAVVLSSRKQDDLEREAAAINAKHPGKAIAIAANAGREQDLKRLVDGTLEQLGRIDIVVNNAGTNPYFGPTLDAETSAWDKTFEVNLRGYWLLTKLAYHSWMAANGGCVLNIASTGGLRPSIGLGVYDITKAGVVMLTRQLAKEIGGTVRVNCIAPGLIKTRFAEALWNNETVLNRYLTTNPMKRIGQPEEIAGAACFLVSDAASYINGQVLVIDGGGAEGA